MPGRFVPIPPGTDAAQQIAMLNKNFAELDHENVAKLFYDANGIPSISIGVQPDQSSRIRIAKPGVDVTAATDDELAFNSAQNVFKIVDVMTVDTDETFMTAGGAGVWDYNATTVTRPHGLPFVPSVLAYVEDGAGGYFLCPYTSFTRASGSQVSISTISVYTDATNVNIVTNILSLNSSGSLGPLPVKIYLMQETAN
jgi:hypothetical protein